MKLYENYLFDETEKLLADAHKELAVDENNDGLLVYRPENELLSNTENKKVIYNEWAEQAHIIDGIYCTICKLMDIHDIDYCCGGGMISFSRLLSVVNNQETLNESPRLSREKLLQLKPHELSDVLIEMFLDRENWSKDVLYSTRVSDGNGNWLI